MQDSNAERLLHNLQYSNSVVVYTESSSPIQRHLPLFGEQFNLCYITSTADDTMQNVRGQIIKQWFRNPLMDPNLTLIESFSQFDNGTNQYVLIVKNCFISELIRELIALHQLFAGRVRVVIEVVPEKASEIIRKFKAAKCSVLLIGELYGPITEEKPSFAHVYQQETKRSPFSYWLFAAAGLIVASAIGLSIWLYQPKVTDAPTELEAGSENTVLAVKANNKLSQDIDKLKKNRPDYTLEREPEAQPSARKVLNLEGAANQQPSQHTEQSAKLQDLEASSELKDDAKANKAQAVNTKQANETSATASLADISSQTTEPELSPSDKSHLPVANNAPAKAEAGVTSDFDNVWFEQANPKHYVLQLAVLSNQKVLNDYLQANQLHKQVKIYHALTGYGVVFGEYGSIKQAKLAIKNLPSNIDASKVWPKPISAIRETLINQTAAN
ncbi:hypothetical protein C2869_08660 [Saccharobesus litoralis]|uniref:SPOR domain-containing protein n=1 Tax=Saccharobesus litoralis TaxID=2172099 RepID=A0A2S0VQL6_9ALTE|nr:hypothetical protein [Saccharobesus litoralis]AWB66494.1 hypothetical protein C2869_08660 [Saccharobesus litoralis]